MKSTELRKLRLSWTCLCARQCIKGQGCRYEEFRVQGLRCVSNRDSPYTRQTLYSFVFRTLNPSPLIRFLICVSFLLGYGLELETWGLTGVPVCGGLFEVGANGVVCLFATRPGRHYEAGILLYVQELPVVSLPKKKLCMPAGPGLLRSPRVFGCSGKYVSLLGL